VAGTDRVTRFCAGTSDRMAGVLDAMAAGDAGAETGLTDAGLTARFAAGLTARLAAGLTDAGLTARFAAGFTDARTAGFGAGMRAAAVFAARVDVRLVRVAGRAVARFGVADAAVRVVVRLAAGLTVRAWWCAWRSCSSRPGAWRRS
jgi:hypothetical protein